MTGSRIKFPALSTPNKSILAGTRQPGFLSSRLATFMDEITAFLTKGFRKRTKYGNVKTWHGGQYFDSKAEKKRWYILKEMEKRGEISDLQRQVKFIFGELLYPSNHTPYYVADFIYRDTKTGEYIVEDVKGGKATITAEFRLKWALMLYFYQIRVKIVEM